jgi:class 3 adenylate cyclase
MHDVRAILDEVGSERASLFGASEGGPMSLLYAATYPERTSALVLYGSYARRSWASDYPFGWKDEQWQRVFDDIERNWGRPQSRSGPVHHRAKLVELSGEDHTPWFGDSEVILDQIEQFLTGRHHTHEPERVLATVLFADIVGSTERAASLGDRPWRELLEAFHAKVREVLRQYHGREINTSGDGFFAAFDGPARAIRCAGVIRNTVRSLNLDVRCGLHTGECERVGNDLAGIAVHIGARFADLAAPGEVLVSQTVRDLVAGSGLAFEDRGTHILKGVPNDWRLFSARIN